MTDAMTTPTGPPTSGTLGASLDETVIEELVPARGARRDERGERPLLEVRGLRTSFHTRDGVVRAVDGHRLPASTAARSWASSASRAAARA